jgi:hypothetical protein
MTRRKNSSAAVGYIAGYVTSTNQKHQADVLVAYWVDNIHGAVFGTAVYRSTDLRLVPNAVKYLIAQSFREEKL